MTRAETVVLDELTLGSRETGTPAELPVLLLHATGESARDWDGFAAALAGPQRTGAHRCPSSHRSRWTSTGG